MKGIRRILVLPLCAVFSQGLLASVMAGAGYTVKLQPYERQIKSIKVDKCGLPPGSCEGSVILAKAAGGGEVALAITPGT